MVKEQFEMNSNSLNAYEAMLREACRSQAEEYEDEYEEDWAVVNTLENTSAVIATS